MIPQDPRVEQKVKILKNPRLGKIRYRLRTLLFLLFELKEDEIHQKMGEAERDDSLSYDGKNERWKELRKEREKLIISFSQSPINCSMCGSREEDLIYQLDNHMWVCHNRERCHQRVELYAQDVRRQLRERERKYSNFDGVKPLDI